LGYQLADTDTKDGNAPSAANALASLVTVDGNGKVTSYLDISRENVAKVANTSNRVPGALEVISAAIDQVGSYKAEWGAGQNRLQYTVANLMNVVEFTTAARSRIQDADFAVEAARLAKAQVLQQTGTAMLAQANAAPQLALQLLK
jgi:flagellin